MTSADWVSIVGHIAWPLTFLIVGLALRRPIGDSLAALAGRISRISVMEVSLDLVAAQEASLPWQSRYSDSDVRGLVAAQDVNDSYFDTLRQSLATPGTADFIVVDLKSDGRQEWLTSRLYLFTYLLSRLKGVRAVVFVATRGDVSRYFLGIAPADGLLSVLARQDSRLRLARLQVEAEQVGRLDPDGPPGAEPNRVPPTDNAPTIPQDVDEWWSQVRTGTLLANPLNVAQRFLTRLQWEPPAPDPPDAPAGWLKLPAIPGRPETWEHASWITSSDLTDGFLGSIVRPEDYVVDDLGWTTAERVSAIAAVPGDLIALLSVSRRFKQLVDRSALLETLGEKSVQPAPKP